MAEVEPARNVSAIYRVERTNIYVLRSDEIILLFEN